MDEVAAEAGVSRATIYRYFSTREELILGVLLSRLDAALDEVIRSLRHPADAARSIPDLILHAIGLVYRDKVSKALFSPDSRSLVTAVEMTAEPIVDGVLRRLTPLLRQWQSEGQLHPDLDLRMTVRWMNVAAVTPLTPPWLEMPLRGKRAFLNQYLVRALVIQNDPWLHSPVTPSPRSG
jgi:AcrR family transcriptional regulator